MPKTRLPCPNCRQPIIAEIDQLFDVNHDPSAKQRFLSGNFNIAQCPSCGYRGNLATPLVYHDADKELLLTFVPPEIGLPRNEQERLIGSMINQILNTLPQEKRKGYLLRPQTALTLQGIVEQILEADGITKEMIQTQQKRLELLQRLMDAPTPEGRAAAAKSDDALIDPDFFALLERLGAAAEAGGDAAAVQGLRAVERAALENSTYGQKVLEQSREVESAAKELREIGRELTREKLLELVIKAPSEVRLSAYVSLARPGMDYQFFQMLSERIDRARADGRERLVSLREKLLALTREVDLHLEARAGAAQAILQKILAAEDVQAEMERALPAVDEFFIQELNRQVEAANRSGDPAQLEKLGKVMAVLQKVSGPPGLGLIEELLDAPDDAARQAILEAQREEITPEFLETLSNIVMQVQSGNDPQLAARVSAVHRQVLRMTMQANLNK